MNFVEEFGPAAFISRARKEGARDFGACMSPTTAFQVLQGMETLPLRMQRHIANTRAIVEFLGGLRKLGTFMTNRFGLPFVFVYW